jgi:hypothetical protein
MYWNKQEEVIFDIVLFILVVFQILTFFVLKSGVDSPQYGIILVSLNLLLMAAIVPYAKWVWKTVSYKKAFLQVAKHELVILVLIVLGIIVALLFNNMKTHA